MKGTWEQKWKEWNNALLGELLERFLKLVCLWEAERRDSFRDRPLSNFVWKLKGNIRLWRR